MLHSSKRHCARGVKTNAPIRCKECADKNAEIDCLQKSISLQSLEIVRLQRQLALLEAQISSSCNMVDASVGNDSVNLDFDKPKTCDSYVQSPVP